VNTRVGRESTDVTVEVFGSNFGVLVSAELN